VLALVGLVVPGALTGRDSRLAAQLAFDHAKCLLLAGRAPGAAPDDVAREWSAGRGWAITAPPSSEEHRLALLGVRRCLCLDGEMAHLLYEHRGRRVSLFILRGTHAVQGLPAIMGYGFATWQNDARTYVTVAELAPAELARLADYFETHAR
jgi:anti-sigma factor RsiW